MFVCMQVYNLHLKTNMSSHDSHDPGQGQKNFRTLFKDAFFNTVLTGIIYLLILVVAKLINFHALSPAAEAIRDFNTSDFITSQEEYARTQMVDDIVLLNIDKSNREQILTAVLEAERYQPKVIGLDVFFDPEITTVPEAATTLRQYKNIVYASRIEGKDYDWKRVYTKKVQFTDTIQPDHSKYGYTSHPGDSISTLRKFAPFVRTMTGFENGFPLAVMRLYSPASTDVLLKRDNPLELINYRYTARNFRTLEIEDLQRLPADTLRHLLEGRILLAGFMSNDADQSLIDRHFTPLNKVAAGHTMPDMYGVVVVANICKMIADKDYINPVYPPLNLLFLLIVVFLFNVIIVFLDGIKGFSFLFHPAILLMEALLVLGLFQVLYKCWISGYYFDYGTYVVLCVVSVYTYHVYQRLAKSKKLSGLKPHYFKQHT